MAGASTATPAAESIADPTMAPVVIRTRGLGKRYGDHVAVRSLDLDVHAGEVFGLLGPERGRQDDDHPHAAGPLGADERTGRGRSASTRRATRSQVKRHVGYLPDAVGFYGSMTGRENLRYTCRLNGIEAREAERRIDRRARARRPARRRRGPGRTRTPAACSSVSAWPTRW